MSGVVQTPGCGVTDFASTDTPEKLTGLGEVAFFNGYKHRFVKAHTACLNDIILPGAVLYQIAGNENVVTNLVASSATASVNSVAGIAPQLAANVPESTSSIEYFFWMQCLGEGVAIVNTNGDDDIAAGDSIVAGGDGVCDSDSTPDANAYIGTAMAADVDSSNTVVVRLR